MTPTQAITLNVDTARKSGWCISDCGSYVDSGVVSLTKPFELESVCERAVALSKDRNLPCILVLEYHPWKGRSIATAAGLGASGGVWKHAWMRSGGRGNKVVKAAPSEWRGPVLGVTRPTAVVQAMERNVAKAIAGKPVESQDESAAVCISRWSSMAAKVRAKVKPAKALACR